MIQLYNISKTYNKKTITALSDISFEVNKGEIFGLIGPDGAGKSTLFRILTTLLLPDNGEAIVNGHHVVKDYKEIRKHVGYMPGKFSLYMDLTIEENLNFFATVFNTTVQENYYLIEEIYKQLEPFKDRRAGKLSGGMKQKLALCCALIHKPEVLFLDEPTTGVDVVSRREFWMMLQKLKKQGLTILVSTPYMDEASLCDRIAFIDKGTILSINTPDNFIQLYPKELFGIKTSNTFNVLTALRNNRDTHSCYAFGESIHLTLKEKATSQQITDHLNTLYPNQFEVEKISPSLEDCFIELLNKV